MRIHTILQSAGMAAAAAAAAAPPMTMTDFSRAFEDLAGRVSPAVVQVHVTGFGRGEPGLGRERSGGSGAIAEQPADAPLVLQVERRRSFRFVVLERD